MSIDRKFPINVDPRMKGILEAIYGAIDELQRRPVTATLSPADLKTLASQAATQAAGLIGPFATPVIGQGADPALTGIPTGNGTVTSVTVSAGTNLTGGGTITTAGSVTLNLSGNPSVTTVDAATSYKIAGTKVVGAQGAAVADATDAATAISQLNLLLARVRAHGLIA